MDSAKVSSQGHQSQYEMFGSRDIPFHGDYNWISLAERPDGTLLGYMAWTDNRDVVPGPTRASSRPRTASTTASTCSNAGSTWAHPSRERRRSARPTRRAFTGDNCGNAGGLDQNIYGTNATFE